MRQEEITRLFPMHIRKALSKAAFDMEQVYEIRLRVNGPLILIYQGKEYFPVSYTHLTLPTKA